MKPRRILSAIRFGHLDLNAKYAVVKALWRDFGRALRADRRRRKIRLKDFARGMGISPTYASYLESGKREWSIPRAELAVKLLTRREQWPT